MCRLHAVLGLSLSWCFMRLICFALCLAYAVSTHIRSMLLPAWCWHDAVKHRIVCTPAVAHVASSFASLAVLRMPRQWMGLRGRRGVEQVDFGCWACTCYGLELNIHITPWPNLCGGLSLKCCRGARARAPTTPSGCFRQRATCRGSPSTRSVQAICHKSLQ